MQAMHRAIGLASAFLLVGSSGTAATGHVISVGSQPEFTTAVAALRATGGTIRLEAKPFERRLLVAGRFGGPLRIEAEDGARVQRLLLYRTRNVTIGPLRLAPLSGDARLRVLWSRTIVLHDLLVSAEGTRYSASVEIPNSRWVLIRRSEFTHCGDRSPNWSNCVLLRDRSHHVTIADSRFHDCYGCDFVHGRFGSHLTVRGSRFTRALPCRLSQLDMRLTQLYLGKYASVRCGHQDDIELFSGDDLVFEHNYFGVYERGGAQLYVTGESHKTLIANNTFVGTDPRVPRYRSKVGVLVGGNGGGPVPYFARVVHNRIYTGARRIDGYEASISISRAYLWRVPKDARPVIAHNIIGLLETPEVLCGGAKMVDNTILRGHGCS
jgi:Right handed beta helix region